MRGWVVWACSCDRWVGGGGVCDGGVGDGGPVVWMELRGLEEADSDYGGVLLVHRMPFNVGSQQVV
jgi:hypothetical protein